MRTRRISFQKSAALRPGKVRFQGAARNTDVLYHVAWTWIILSDRFLTLQPLLAGNRTTVVYCCNNTCNKRQTIAHALISLGYRNIKVFQGGWSEWNAAYLPMWKLIR